MHACRRILRPARPMMACLVGLGVASLGDVATVRADPADRTPALTPAGQGPLTVAPPEAWPVREAADAASRSLPGRPTVPSPSAPAAWPRGRPPIDVQLVPAAAGPAASAPPAPRPLPPRRKAPPRAPASFLPTTAAARPASLVAGSLAAVLGLLALIVWCTRRFAPPGMTLLPKEVFEPLGRAMLPGQQPVQLVRLGPKLLLVAQHGGSLTTLAEVTDPVEVEHLLGLCRRQRPDSATAAFREVLAHLTQGPQSPWPEGTRQTAGGGR